MLNSQLEQRGDGVAVDPIATGVSFPLHQGMLARVSRISLATAMMSGLVLAAGPVGSAAASPVGAFGLFDIPQASSSPHGIAKGADGNMWFIELTGNRVSRITPTGAITEFPIPTAGSWATSITLGPDGSM